MKTYQLIYNGYLTPQKNGVKIVLSILHQLSLSVLLMVITRRRIKMLFHLFYLMHQQLVSITMQVTITYRIMKRDLSSTTRQKRRSRSILSSLTRLRKEVYRIRLSTLLLLAQGLESLYSCVMWLAQVYSKGKMSSTSLSKWQRRKLRRGLMLIYLMSIYKRQQIFLK